MASITNDVVAVDARPEGPLTFSQMHNLKECVEKCKYIDDARKVLSSDSDYNRCFELCNCVILNLAQCYKSNEGIACHALMIAQTFIATAKPEDHIKNQHTVRFGVFWRCVAVVCYTLAMNFSEMKSPIIQDLLCIAQIPYLPNAKKFYKYSQMHVLSSIKWKLHFPTGETITVYVSYYSDGCCHFNLFNYFKIIIYLTLLLLCDNEIK